MAMVYEAANGVQWRICPDETDPSCAEVLEGLVVSFQRLGREDIVICSPGVAYPETIQERRMAFEEGGERRWTDPETDREYRVQMAGGSLGEPDGLRIVSRSGSAAIVPDPRKPIGLLRDAELRAYVEGASDGPRG